MKTIFGENPPLYQSRLPKLPHQPPRPFYFCKVKVIVCMWSLHLFFSVTIMAGIFPVSIIIFNKSLRPHAVGPDLVNHFPTAHRAGRVPISTRPQRLLFALKIGAGNSICSTFATKRSTWLTQMQAWGQLRWNELPLQRVQGLVENSGSWSSIVEQRIGWEEWGAKTKTSPWKMWPIISYV